MIIIQETLKQLNITSSTLYNAKKYQKYIIRREKQKNLFNMSQYSKDILFSEYLKEQMWNFVFYAKWICSEYYTSFFNNKVSSSRITYMDIPAIRLEKYVKKFIKKNPKCFEFFIKEYDISKHMILHLTGDL